MELRPTPVAGCLEVHAVHGTDRRGSFTKWFHSPTFAAAGIDLAVAELFVSVSGTGVVRGLHFQRPPADVAKLVVCLRGRVLDVVVDLRTDSATFGEHVRIELSPEHANALVVPLGCAHGFLALEDDSTVVYAQSGPHDAELEGGILWSSAGVDWGITTDGAVLSDRDAGFPTLAQFASPFRMEA